MQFIEANGAKIPAIGLGTWELRGRTCSRLVEQALKLGYRHIDTAQVYENEHEVGEGLRASRVRREEIFITTKVWTTHFAPNDLERSTKESLRTAAAFRGRLLLLHWPNPHVPLGGNVGRAGACQKLGMTRHIGVSNFTVALLDEAVPPVPEPLVCDQVEYHPYLDQTKVKQAWPGTGWRLVAYSPVAKGRIKHDETWLQIGKPITRPPPRSVCAGWCSRMLRDTADIAARAAVGEYRYLRFRVCPTRRCSRYTGMGSAKGRLTDFGFAPKWD